ncbi:MAG: hypothetical protein IIA44_11380 [Acidobacteria bacterium]|nr:hypothetical protein [Acidobacteriota bacterium]
MSAILEVLSTGGLVLLALALVLWGRHWNRRPPSIEWPMDLYFHERRRWVKPLNDERRRRTCRGKRRRSRRERRAATAA